MEWELILECDDSYTYRAWVPGGWLVRVDSHWTNTETAFYAEGLMDQNQVSVPYSGCGLTFLPDSEHNWSP
jgi:hypothetical protein